MPMESDVEKLKGLLQSERRRLIFDRALERHRAAGTPIDGDPIFMSVMAEWIDGRIEMREVARRRGAGRNARAVGSPPTSENTAGAESSNELTQTALLAELDRIIGLKDVG